MDQYLADRWLRGASPFDGSVLTFLRGSEFEEYLLRVEDLREILRISVGVLQEAYGDAPLVGLEDWHEHDGIVLPGNPMRWSDLQHVLQSDSALYEARHGDTYVHRAYYPRGGGFLLRFDIGDDSRPMGSSELGTFDVAAGETHLAAIMARCPPYLHSRLRLEDARHYFDRISAA